MFFGIIIITSYFRLVTSLSSFAIVFYSTEFQARKETEAHATSNHYTLQPEERQQFITEQNIDEYNKQTTTTSTVERAINHSQDASHFFSNDIIEASKSETTPLAVSSTAHDISQTGQVNFQGYYGITSPTAHGSTLKSMHRNNFKYENHEFGEKPNHNHLHPYHHPHHRHPHTIVFHALEIFICIFLSCFIMLVVVGNAYVILAVCVFEKMRTLSNGLIASLATADFMVALAVMPISLHRELTKGLWTLGWAICDFWVTADVLCCTASILNIAVIALDRYWLITRNVKYTHSDRCPRRRTCALMLASAWLTALLISCAPLLGWRHGDEKNDPTQCVISQDYAYTLFSTVGAFWLPLGVILAVYSRVFTFARQRVVRRRQKHQGEKAPKCSQKKSNGLYADPKSLLSNHNNGIMAVAMAISRKLSVPVNYQRKQSKTETSSFTEARKFSLSPQAENYTATTPFLIDQETTVEDTVKDTTPVKVKRSFFSVTLAASRLLRLHRKRQEQKKERKAYAEASSSFSRDDDEYSNFRSRAETSQDLTSDCYSRNGSVFIEAETYDDMTGDVLGMARNYEELSAAEGADGSCTNKVRQVCIVPSKRLLLTPTACETQQIYTRPRSKKRSKKSSSTNRENQKETNQKFSFESKTDPIKMTSISVIKSKRASSLTVDNTLKQVKSHEKLRCVNSHPVVCPPSILKNQYKPKIDFPRVKDRNKTIVKCSSIPIFHANQDYLELNLGAVPKAINRIDPIPPKAKSFPDCLHKINFHPIVLEVAKLKLNRSYFQKQQSVRKASEIAISVVPPSSLKTVEMDENEIRNESVLHNPESPGSSEGHRGGKVRISDDGCFFSTRTESTSPGIESSTQDSSSEKKSHNERNFRRKFSQRAAAAITSTSDLIKIRQSRRMRKSARTLGLIIGGFLVCWLPFFCLATVTPFCPEICQVPHIISSLTLWLGYFNSLLNPIIYAIWDDNFRRAFKRLSRCDFKR